MPGQQEPYKKQKNKKKHLKRLSPMLPDRFENF